MPYILLTLIVLWVFMKIFKYFEDKKELKKHEMTKKQKDFFKGSDTMDYRGRKIKNEHLFDDILQNKN